MSDIFDLIVRAWRINAGAPLEDIGYVVVHPDDLTRAFTVLAEGINIEVKTSEAVPRDQCYLIPQPRAKTRKPE